ncbi:hypothetical protein [Cyclobacterium sp.]|uniref:hypothetical protein n=1 Tax=Cyclobacterium sp. TaxID=1966343 RepID=UPI0019CDB987|nr:hypothetical protein [Cyclobacterium sp.]MBD3628248.1 hypothetical protein [Cyclobacterium sp.]
MYSLSKAEDIAHFLEWAGEKGMFLEYDEAKHKIRIILKEARIAELRLPVSAEYTPETGQLKFEEKNHILCMVRAGMAAVGYFENGINISHKVFRAYMVRKKQGKSQIKYLKTKGKSRAGSRVRLGESESFFNQINDRISSYLNNYHVDFIGYSCSKTLWPFLFKPDSDLQKNKNLLYKIPFHIQQPTYDKLLEINRLIHLSAIKVEESEKAHFAAYFKEDSDSSQEDELW